MKFYFNPIIHLSMHVRHLRMDVECSLNTLCLHISQDCFCIFDFEYRHKWHFRRLDRVGELVPVTFFSYIFPRFVVGGSSFEELGPATLLSMP